MTERLPEAVVFDFDGTLVDTEWPIYLGARAAFAAFGVDLSEEDWAAVVGMSDGDGDDGGWWGAICERLGTSRIARSEWEAARAAARRDGVASSAAAELTDGAQAIVEALHDRGVPLAVASGSDLGWLEHHLDRFGLRHRFEALVGVDHPEVTAGKPAPDLYRVACRALGVAPAAAAAVEDTARGIAAAKAAEVGLVVAVPSRLTRHHDLSTADRVVASLRHLDVADLTVTAEPHLR